ncbi:hypothetical protein OS493_001980 [Desmophyllum pertusum]|uniref:Uncharacterized protein n=1 Tax=Desmophyllum pertusum TaxID=174260 RepID=A0A9X0CTQ9_9CNID|nr:hypothetical protein OS493_001980 [Desmophyllum pertusum]
MHPVHAVDVLCLLGHESRKEGDKKKYKELMEKAEQISFKEVCRRIYAKRRKERSEAEQKLTEALELFKKLLGKHFMTAECLKAIADLLLLSWERRGRVGQMPCVLCRGH